MIQSEIDEFNHKLGKRLAELRRQEKVTQAQLAEDLHTTKASISRVENGHATADIITMLAYSKRLKMPLSKLIQFADDEEMPSHHIVALYLDLNKKDREIVYRIIMALWALDKSKTEADVWLKILGFEIDTTTIERKLNMMDEFLTMRKDEIEKNGGML